MKTEKQKKKERHFPQRKYAVKVRNTNSTWLENYWGLTDNISSTGGGLGAGGFSESEMVVAEKRRCILIRSTQHSRSALLAMNEY
jgi:hypothetical protein